MAYKEINYMNEILNKQHIHNLSKQNLEILLKDYMLSDEFNDKQKVGLEYKGESLIDFCNNIPMCDFQLRDCKYCIYIVNPYEHKNMNKQLDTFFPYMTVSDILNNPDNWKDYKIDRVHKRSENFMHVFAYIPCKTVADLLFYFDKNIDENCIFEDVLSNKTCNKSYIENHINEFENTEFVYKVDTNEDDKIIGVQYFNYTI